MKAVRRAVIVAVALSLAACSARGRHGSAEKSEEHEKEIPVGRVADRQKTSIADAIGAALAGRSGEALEAGLEGEMENDVAQVFVEVMVLDAHGAATEVKVDAATGKVLSAAPPDETDEAQELADLAKRLPAGRMPLADLARKAAGAAEGKLVSAAFAATKTGAVAEVRFVDEKKSTEVTLDPKSGAVLSKKSKDRKGDDEDEDDDDDDEKDEAK